MNGNVDIAKLILSKGKRKKKNLPTKTFMSTLRCSEAAHTDDNPAGSHCCRPRNIWYLTHWRATTCCFFILKFLYRLNKHSRILTCGHVLWSWKFHQHKLKGDRSLISTSTVKTAFQKSNRCVDSYEKIHFEIILPYKSLGLRASFNPF